jgi:UDP-N-acetylmuramate--alanine ligase
MKHIHFIGIGGIGMSALAQHYVSEGYRVTGSDASPSPVTHMLAQLGIEITYEQKAENIEASIRQVIYTISVPQNHPELGAARDQQIPVLTYPEALGELTRQYRTIAVVGTHGKTTTTAMLALALIAGGEDPTVIVGSTVKAFGGTNYRKGKSDWLVIEACEYRESFLHYQPEIVLVTNIDLDHMDYFTSLAHYQEAFLKLFMQVGKKGKVVYLREDKVTKVLLERLKEEAPEGVAVATEEDLSVGVPGVHNRKNGSLVLGVATLFGLEETRIREALTQFSGTTRRFEYRGTTQTGAKIYEDYAHHPEEIRVTLGAAREKFPQEKIICIFQPHQYSRTFALKEEFAISFGEADLVLIPNIYRVRDTEEDVARISPEALVALINGHKNNALFSEGFASTKKWIAEHTEEGDVLFFMGAGTITQLAQEMIA